MNSEHGGPTPIPVSAADRRSFDLFPGAGGTSNSASTTTVLVAFLMNVLVAVAKIRAAAVTGSASMVAEAAHSWADSGNEIFLRPQTAAHERPPDAKHPIGQWEGGVRLVAGRGARAAGRREAQSRSCVVCRNFWSRRPGYFVVAYVVLAVSFVLESVSFARSIRQSKPEADSMHRT